MKLLSSEDPSARDQGKGFNMFLDMNTNRFNLLAEFRNDIQRHVNEAFEGLDELMMGVTIHFSDINGPRGGICKRCRIVVKTARVGDVIVRETQRSFRLAAYRAIDKAKTALHRRLDKRRNTKRSGNADGRRWQAEETFQEKEVE